MLSELIGKGQAGREKSKTMYFEYKSINDFYFLIILKTS